MSDGGYVYATPGEYHHVDLRDSSSMFPQIGEELYSHIAYVFKCSRLEAVQILALARSKYTCVNFRKKGRRKLKRSMRIHRKNWHSRSKTNGLTNKIFKWEATNDLG